MYETLTLANGVRIVTEHMPAMRSASLGIWVGVGSRMEKAAEAGSAHFIEHMLFKSGRRRSARELAADMDAIGGQCNAFTSRENTCFYARALDSHLHKAIGILSEMFFDALFDEAEFENERGVIGEEMDMYRDDPEDLVVEQQLRRCFPGSLGRPVLGSRASLARLSGESLRSFKDREYGPGRVVLSLCGSFGDEHVRALAERFGAMEPRQHRRPAAARYTPSLVLRKKATEQNHISLGFPGLPAGHEDRFAWQLLSAVFGEGSSSRLFQTVREKYGLCYAIGSFTASYRDCGFFGISTAVNRDAEEKALRLIADELRRLREDGVRPEELSRARDMIKTGLLMGLESTSAHMQRLGAAVLSMGRCLSVEEVLERYDAVTEEDLLRVARTLLDPARSSLSALGHPGDENVYRSLFSE